MENSDFEKLSDFDIVQAIEKYCIHTSKRSDKFIPENHSIKEISPINNISHILFSDKLINEDNFMRNFSNEQLDLISKRTQEIMKILKSMSENSISGSGKKQMINSKSNESSIVIDTENNFLSNFFLIR